MNRRLFIALGTLATAAFVGLLASPWGHPIVAWADTQFTRCGTNADLCVGLGSGEQGTSSGNPLFTSAVGGATAPLSEATSAPAAANQGIGIQTVNGANVGPAPGDASFRLIIVGPGTAGTPAGGVLSIQGVSGGTNVGVGLPYGSSAAAAVANSFTGDGCVFNTTLPAPTNGQFTPCQADASGRMLVDAGQFNTSLPTLSSGQHAPAALDSNGRLILSPTSSIATSQYNSSLPTLTNATLNPLSEDINGRAIVTGQGPAGSALAGNPVVGGVEVSGNAGVQIGCDNTVDINDSTSGDLQLVALVAAKTIYVCGYNVVAAGPVSVQLEYGTGTNCGTGKTVMAGPYPLGAQSGVSDPAPIWRGMKTASANELCINLNAAVQVGGVVYYTQF